MERSLLCRQVGEQAGLKLTGGPGKRLTGRHGNLPMGAVNRTKAGRKVLCDAQSSAQRSATNEITVNIL